MAAPRRLHPLHQHRHLTHQRRHRTSHIDWQSVITSRDTGLLPCSSGENRILRLAASIAAGIPADLNDALSGLDQHSISFVVRAIRHANGQRPADYAGS